MTSAKAYKDAALAARLSDRYYLPKQDCDPSFTAEVEQIGNS